MNSSEERVRLAMHDLADQVRPADILVRLDRAEAQRPALVVVRQWALAFAVVVLATTLALGALVLLRGEEPSIVEPVQQPPKVFRLGVASTEAPGPVHLAVTLAPEGQGQVSATYVVGPGGGPATLLSPSMWVPHSEHEHVTLDGTRMLRQDIKDPRIEVVDLRTGSRDHLGGALGYCPQLSPDHRTIVMWSHGYPVGVSALSLLDTRSGSVRPGPRDPRLQAPGPVSGQCTGLAWSPDGQVLAVPAARGSFVSDLRGQVRHRMPHRYAVNGSMSWSPDGRALLLWNSRRAMFVVHDLETGRETSLAPPRETGRPMGWSGSRVVWLTGPPGDQRLITTDQRGGDPQVWTRLDVGDRVVDSVSWSRDLAGRAAD